MSDPHTRVVTARLDLVVLSVATLEALANGRTDNTATDLAAIVEPGSIDDQDLAFFLRRSKQAAEQPQIRPWIARAMILREPVRRMIGHAGFHGPPGVNGLGVATAVEIGYTVFPSYRGAGYATEAATGLIEWASEFQKIAHFIASIAPGNRPSEAIMVRLGFTRTGEQWDEEDGLEYIYELELD
jgi:RimJ/RimL family protein N-acetyltransferase